MSGAKDTGAADRGVRAWHLALLVLVPVLVFSNTLENGYHLDDAYRIKTNTELDRVAPIWRHFLDPYTSTSHPPIAQYRPFLPLSYTLTHALADATGVSRLAMSHVGNIAVHIGCVLLLYLLGCELLRRHAPPDPGGVDRGTTALAGALVFAAHPVAGVPVNYLCARDLLLMQLFLLGSLLAYGRMRRVGDSPLGWTVALLLMACSLLSKTNALVAPVLVLAFELVLGGGRFLAWDTWRRVLPFAGLSVGFVAWTRWGLDFSDAGQLLIDRSPLEYPLTQLDVHLTHYARNLFWPFRLRPEPHVDAVTSVMDPAVLGGAVLVVGSLLLAGRWRDRLPVASFGILGYWILFALTSSVLPMRRLATDYRQVPSLALLCLGLAALLARRLPAPTRRPLLVVLVLYLAASGWWMNRVWVDGETLWGHTVAHGGRPNAHLNYGRSLMRKDPELAEFHLHEALRLAPNQIFAMVNLGVLHGRQGDPEAVEWVDRAVAARPDWGLTHKWRAEVLGMLGRHEEANASWRQAAELAPRDVEYQYRAALAAQTSGDVAGSRAYLDRLHAVVDAHRDSRFLEGFALQSAGETAAALAAYDRHLAGAPEHAKSWFNRGLALRDLGRHEEAVESLLRSLELDPDNRSAHYHLSTCYQALGRQEDALRERALYDAGG